MFNLDWSVGDVLLVLFALQLGAAAIVAGTMVAGSMALAAEQERKEAGNTPLDAFEASLAAKTTVPVQTEVVHPVCTNTEPVSLVSATVYGIPAVFRRKLGVTTLADSHEARKAWRAVNYPLVPKPSRKARTRKKVAEASESKFDSMA